MKISKERLKEIIKEEVSEISLKKKNRGPGPTVMGNRPMITDEQADEFTKIFSDIFWDDSINFYRKELAETVKLYSNPGDRLDMSNINSEEMLMEVFEKIYFTLKEERGNIISAAIRNYLNQFIDKEGKWSK